MKTRILLIAFLSLSILHGTKAQNYSFAYDANGNRIGRTIPLKSTLASQDSSGNIVGEEQYNEKIGDIEISLFPNPTKGNIYLNIKNIDQNLSSGLAVYDNSGKLLKTIENLTEYNTIDLSNLPPGSYFIKIIIGDAISDWKVIKD
jgi:YD repeat-containing protein